MEKDVIVHNERLFSQFFQPLKNIYQKIKNYSRFQMKNVMTKYIRYLKVKIKSKNLKVKIKNNLTILLF